MCVRLCVFDDCSTSSSLLHPARSLTRDLTTSAATSQTFHCCVSPINSRWAREKDSLCQIRLRQPLWLRRAATNCQGTPKVVPSSLLSHLQKQLRNTSLSIAPDVLMLKGNWLHSALLTRSRGCSDPAWIKISILWKMSVISLRVEVGWSRQLSGRGSIKAATEVWKTKPLVIALLIFSTGRSFVAMFECPWLVQVFCGLGETWESTSEQQISPPRPCRPAQCPHSFQWLLTRAAQTLWQKSEQQHRQMHKCFIRETWISL